MEEETRLIEDLERKRDRRRQGRALAKIPEETRGERNPRCR